VFLSKVFNQCIGSTEPSEELSERLEFLRGETSLATYTNISRGLFEKDKLIFSFMLCADILKSKDAIKEAEWSFFIRGGGTSVESGRTKKPATVTWISEARWGSICDLETVFENFQGITLSALEHVVPITIGSFKIVNYSLINFMATLSIVIVRKSININLLGHYCRCYSSSPKLSLTISGIRD